MKNKKLEIFLSIVLMVLMVLWTVGTIFAFENKIKAKADSVDVGYHFVGSNVIMNTLVFPNYNYADGNTYGTITNQFFNFRVEFVTGQFSAYNTYGGFNFAYTLSSGSSSSFNSYFYSPTSTSLDSIRFVVAKNYVNGEGLFYRGWYYQYSASTITWTTFSSSVPTFVNNGWYLFKSTSNTYMWIYFNMETDFNGNIYKVEEGNEPVYIQQTGDQSVELTGFLNYIKYYDVNDKVATFGFYTYCLYGTNQAQVSIFKNNSIGKYFTLQDRTYYLRGGYTESEQYNIGFTDGLNYNQPNIYDNGYNAGYNAGDNVGYARGYNEGATSAGNYTFLGLLGAVVDAPITALTGLLNFNLLGFNMLTFFYAIMTLCLIIFVVRLLLGGK